MQWNPQLDSNWNSSVGVHWLSAPTVDCRFLRWSSLTHWLYYWSCLVHWLNQCQCPCSRWRIFAVFADLGRPHALLILLHWKINNPPPRQRQRSRFSWAGLKNKSSGDWRGRKPYYSVLTGCSNQYVVPYFGQQAVPNAQMDVVAVADRKCCIYLLWASWWAGDSKFYQSFVFE